MAPVASPGEDESVVQQVTDKLEGAHPFAFGAEPPPRDRSSDWTLSGYRALVYRETQIQEMGECIKLLGGEIDRLRAAK